MKMNLRQVALATMVLVVLVFTSLWRGAIAGEAETFARFDGVIMSCRVSGLVKFERKLCARTTAEIERLADENNILITDVGVFKTKSASKSYDEETNPTEYKKPLVLRVLVSGTKGRTPGALIQIIAGELRPDGFLMIWDKRVLSSGPAKKIVQIVPDVMAKRTKDLFERMAPN